MSPHVQTGPFLVAALKTLTLVLGGTITYFSYKAYARTGSPALRALAIGFGLVTVGAILAGVTDVVLNVRIETSLLIESTLTALGFGVILYSLYASPGSSARSSSSRRPGGDPEGRTAEDSEE